ncbi:MAG TPA: CDP-alcohol phosphatidyltransferase family protein [Amaricoccus sp.]|uniref:CDP-alcohol phosphatidyltransferase family protein n=1 Tax=Amaricoccus sp. TaxID=1872485 RepID=UPI002C33F13E|nr:CDP-alcohol phosphatidyltransferase family protein [Amaricoccus sp.]HMQ93279.1 CDP-alcohol phosphatidyltransferase family protein [Amaricoccus sp.]HMR54305.1 CDP-alcohol phosphatidyltransferase family protein [Amaricoccus sp.]HMR60106.1 CDP-alcohol phosphatidyltransferase family protein [Amaricoccus sp.]HMU01278.1 CDP-alcohol phosphatidyltransferase family protein [Amaricoccus sp.]
MTGLVRHRSPAGPGPGALAATAAAGAGLAALLAALPLATAHAPALALALFALVALAVRDRLAVHHPHDRFGAANAVTLLRAAGVAAFAALALEPGILAGSAAWWAAAGGALILALDGIDGALARRQRTASAFGARFDMEVDALFVLVLAALALGLGKAGPWVLGLGLMRYGFVAAGYLAPALRAPLPPSFRRKAVCVFQIAVLAILLAPPLAPPVSSSLAALAFAALAASFAIDIRRLLRPPA